MNHSRLYNFLNKNKERVIFFSLTTIIIEAILHNYELGATFGFIGLVLNSHILCCLLPLGLTAIFHKKDCHCHRHHNPKLPNKEVE